MALGVVTPEKLAYITGGHRSGSIHNRSTLIVSIAAFPSGTLACDLRNLRVLGVHPRADSMKVFSVLLVAIVSLMCLQGTEAKKGKGLGLLFGLGGLAAAGGAGALLLGSHHHHPPPKKHVTHIHL